MTTTPYTDRDLIEQIDSELATFLALWSADDVTKTLIENLRWKIDSHRRGERWWEGEEEE